MNIQFWAKFIILLTNIIYNITNRAENTHTYILVCHCCWAIFDVSDDHSKYSLILYFLF